MELREQVNLWIDKHGTKISWLARQLECTSSHLYYFLAGHRTISQEKKDKLREIISR